MAIAVVTVSARALFALSGSVTTLEPNSNPAASGQAVTFTALVTPLAATGTVEFFDGSSSIGTAPVVPDSIGGYAQLTTSTLSPGIHAITATYSGDSTYAASTSSPVPEHVGTVDVGVTGFVSGAAGSPVNLNFTVTNHGPDPVEDVFFDAPLGDEDFASATTNVGTCSLLGTAVQCVLPVLASGDSASIVIAAIPKTLMTKDNHAEVSAFFVDTNAVNNHVDLVFSPAVAEAPALSPALLALLGLILGAVALGRVGAVK